MSLVAEGRCGWWLKSLNRLCCYHRDCVQVSKASSAQASTVQATSAAAAAPLPATVPLAAGQVAAAAAGKVVALRAECAHMDEQLALVSAQLDAVHSERDAEQCGPVLRSQRKRGLCSSVLSMPGFRACAKQRFKCCYCCHHPI